jgi:hypothetical protein
MGKGIKEPDPIQGSLVRQAFGQIRIAVDERNREHAEIARFEERPHNGPHSPELLQ